MEKNDFRLATKARQKAYKLRRNRLYHEAINAFSDAIKQHNELPHSKRMTRRIKAMIKELGIIASKVHW
jgi:quinol monooxygenase YgiN